jgi:hypothetical protein
MCISSFLFFFFFFFCTSVLVKIYNMHCIVSLKQFIQFTFMVCATAAEYDLQ